MILRHYTGCVLRYFLGRFFKRFKSFSRLPTSAELSESGTAEEGGGQGGQLPTSHGAGGTNISFCPPPTESERTPRKNCEENALHLYGRFEGPFMRSEDPGSLWDSFGSSEGPVSNSEDPFRSLSDPSISAWTLRQVCILMRYAGNQWRIQGGGHMGHDPPLGARGHHRPARGTTGLSEAPQACQGHHRPDRGTTGPPGAPQA